MLQVPHSGYHWQGVEANFFEGWYLRVTLPKLRQSFALMYSIEDPLGNSERSGGAVQILGIDEGYVSHRFPDVRKFWASKTELQFGHWGDGNYQMSPQLLPIDRFDREITTGYQVTATLNQGALPDLDCRWCYRTVPVYTWGQPHLLPQATAGLLSFLPIFEPGWQILMAHGLATGWIEWQGQRYEFTNAPAYSEKNWGRSFPERWFWIECNSFEDSIGLAVTAGGGKRQVLWAKESVGMVGVHYRDRFYEFVPWNSQIEWQIQPWGKWQIRARNRDWEVDLLGTTDLPGVMVATPTAAGLVSCCRDTLRGLLSIDLRTADGQQILRAHSNNAGLEVGGRGWEQAWQNSSAKTKNLPGQIE